MSKTAPEEPIGSFKGFGLLVDYLQAAGCDVDLLLSQAGVDREMLRDDDVRVRDDEIGRLWRLAIGATGDPALPLRVAATVRRSSLGVFGYLAAASESGEDGFDRASRLVGLMTEGVDLELSRTRDDAIIRILYREGHRPRRETSEFAVGIMVCMSRLIPPGVAEPKAAWFAHRAPPHAVEYERILGLPVRFDATHDAVVFSRATFDTPNPNADAVLRELIERYATRALAELPHGERLADRVRAAIERRLDRGKPSVGDVARDLRMSARTLRRRLEREETSFRAILDDLRREIALRALDDEGASVDEVAQRTGFSDASAFHKAFRRWTGRSPARP